ncbi:MAG: polynucleotide adenylyltransferase PcnB [Parachlamydiales bacterium]
MQPRIYSADEHHIREGLLDPDALEVLQRLHEAGFTAYLVGGGVRDLLMNRRPKDFDISTSARPEQIKSLFRRQCLLIGRRFRLAHIRFGKHIVEVSTFRAGDPAQGELIVRDNVWGNPEEDVLRRDFTINGLYYEPEGHTIIDYVGGVEDLKANLLRSIGEPEIRYIQDPVRMMRCLKFMARFGLKAEEKTLAAIASCRKEILNAAPPRVLEEMLRMFESGGARPFIDLLSEHGLLRPLFPYLADVWKTPLGKTMARYLDAVDKWCQEGNGERKSRSALTCALLYPLLEAVVQNEFLDKGMEPHFGQIHEIVRELIHMALVDTFCPYPKGMRYHIAFILETQYRFTPVTNRRIRIGRLAGHPDFPRALQLLKLRADIDPALEETYARWRGAK